MYYHEYKQAATRHLSTCELLLNICIHEDAWKFTPTEIMDIRTNIYYLSGYVFECLFSYALFSIFHGKRRCTATRYSLIEAMRSYDFQTATPYEIIAENVFRHRFIKSAEKLRQIFPGELDDVPFVNPDHPMVDEDINFLLKSWKSEIRYSQDINLRLNDAILYKIVQLAKKTNVSLTTFIQSNIY